jgi:hypothetical protein
MPEIIAYEEAAEEAAAEEAAEEAAAEEEAGAEEAAAEEGAAEEGAAEEGAAEEGAAEEGAAEEGAAEEGAAVEGAVEETVAGEEEGAAAETAADFGTGQANMMFSFAVDVSSMGTVADPGPDTAVVPAGAVGDPLPVYDADGNVIAYSYSDADGNVIGYSYVDADGNSYYEPADTQADTKFIQFADDPTTVPRPQPNTAPVNSDPQLGSSQLQQLNNAIQQAVESTDTTIPQLSPEDAADLDYAIQQAVEASDPNVLNTGQSLPSDDALVNNSLTSGGTSTVTRQNVPFDPMGDSPFAKWLLYGNDTPILDFLTNDANLQVAQNAALTVSAIAGTIATGGMLLEAAPGIIAAANAAAASAAASISAAASSLTSTLLTAGAGASGILASNPGLEQELEEDAESLGTQLADSIPTGPSFENLIDLSEYEENPEIVDRLSRARQFDIGGYRSLTGAGEYGRDWDNLDSDEALQNAFVRMVKEVGRSSAVASGNPAIALSPDIHRQVINLTTYQMRGMTPEDVLQFHLQQMVGLVPDYVIRMLERESLAYIARTF